MFTQCKLKLLPAGSLLHRGIPPFTIKITVILGLFMSFVNRCLPFECNRKVSSYLNSSTLDRTNRPCLNTLTSRKPVRPDEFAGAQRPLNFRIFSYSVPVILRLKFSAYCASNEKASGQEKAESRVNQAYIKRNIMEQLPQSRMKEPMGRSDLLSRTDLKGSMASTKHI